ncbi:MAG: VCBS repeat-containing protein, partial [Acidobacteria bacterium]|nr:VCBS repeat-containing protein [Acidobacteriota bacterium]
MSPTVRRSLAPAMIAPVEAKAAPCFRNDLRFESLMENLTRVYQIRWPWIRCGSLREMFSGNNRVWRSCRSGCALLLMSPLLEAAGFEDVTAASGIRFQHQKSATSRKYLIESVSGGVAMLDYDGDGRLDLYFVNGAKLEDPMKAGASPDKSDPKYWNRLYRNKGAFAFEDVTETANVRGSGFGMGAAAEDFDGDGRTDLYVAAFPRNLLYRNKGDGTFEDVTARAGVGGGGWSSSAGWMDLDADGAADLIVARYVQWDFEPDIWCGVRRDQQRSYCHPDQFKPMTHLVYRNKRDGTFEKMELPAGKGLGIAFDDFDRDGKPDIAIANDAFPQQLFRNLGAWRFADAGLEMNVAYDDEGRAFSGMGIDFADYDNDGRPDLFINALANQRYALFRNTKSGFDYVSAATGIARASQLRSGWGAKIADFDNDGWKDLFVAQGHVMDDIALTQPAVSYLDPPLLMRNVNGKFIDVSASSGAPFRMPLPARGAAIGDLDNDGWLDIAMNCNDRAPVILRNRGGPGHWLQVDAPPGSTVAVRTSAGLVQHGFASTAGSYLS